MKREAAVFLKRLLEYVGLSFAYVAHLFIWEIDVCIRTQIAAVASRRATNLANHLNLKGIEMLSDIIFIKWLIS